MNISVVADDGDFDHDESENWGWFIREIKKHWKNQNKIPVHMMECIVLGYIQQTFVYIW